MLAARDHELVAIDAKTRMRWDLAVSLRPRGSDAAFDTAAHIGEAAPTNARDPHR